MYEKRLSLPFLRAGGFVLRSRPGPSVAKEQPAGIEKEGKFALREIDKARAGVSARLHCIVNKYIRRPRAIIHAEKALFCFCS